MSAGAQRLARSAAAALAFLALTSCGGGGDDGGAGPLALTTTAVNDSIVGVAYNQTVQATGGKGAKTFSISAGALPAGLTMSSAGAITGTPAGPAGSFNFTVQVADSAKQPATDTQALTIDVVDPLLITTTTLPNTSVGAAYNATVAVSGGAPPYAFGIGPGELPSGLGINAGGVIAGTVAADARSQVFSVFVDDGTFPPQNATQGYEIDVDLEITTTALPDATGGEPYTATLVSQGGLLPLTWLLTAGTLPAGLTGNAATGEISGTPDRMCVAAATALTFQVTDSDTPVQTDTQAAVGLTVNPATLDITTETLPNGTLTVAYNVPVQVSGGVSPYSFDVTSGTLPSQMQLNPNTGQITGTPDTLETQNFEITVTDSCPGPGTATQNLSITITDVALGRNDTIADATFLPGDGTYTASISPSGDPNTVLEPDEDYYTIPSFDIATVTVDINARINGSPLDSVIEIVDENGVILSTCGATLTELCRNDDEDFDAGLLDSRLVVRIAPGGTIVYIHVVDFGGNARPDKFYDLVISGVN